MKVLIISLDIDLFRPDSETLQRHLEYTELIGELHILVLAQGSDKKITEKLQLYSITGQNKFFKLLNAFKKAEKIVRDRKIELIISQDPFFTGLVAWQVKRKFKIPLQIQIHTDFLSPYFWQESFLNKMRVLLAKFLIPKADGLRVVSERIRQSLISSASVPRGGTSADKQFPEITVLPIFVDVQKIKESPVTLDLHKKYPQFNFIILMASRLTKEKNIGLAIEAMSEVSKKYPKTGLIVVGEGPQEKSLKFKVKSLKLMNNIIFEPWTNEAVSCYKTADLFLLTSNYEGYGRTIIEAMAAGVPVVMTDVGIAGEIVKDKENGLVVPPQNKKLLQKAIFDLIENPNERRRLSQNALQTIEKFMAKEEHLEKYKNSLSL